MILALYGAGAMGREFKFIADAAGGWSGIVFIDDNAVSGRLLDCPVFRLQEFLSAYRPEDVRFVVSMGEPQFRKEGYERLKKAGFRGGALIDPSARVAPDAEIGEGCAVCQEAFIGSQVRLEQNSYISVRATIGHDSVIGPHSRIGAGAFIGGSVEVGENAFIGSGALVRDRVRIGDGSIAGLGSVVFSDIPSHVTVIGNPARIANENGDSFLYSSSASQLQQSNLTDRSPAGPSLQEPETHTEISGQKKAQDDLTHETVILKYWEVFTGCFEGIDFNPATFHYQDSGWDSATQMLLISRVEEAFDLHFSGREILKMTSFKAGLKMVQKKLKQPGKTDGKES